MKKLICVIGLSNFGITVCKELSVLKHQVLAVDIDKEVVQAYSNDIDHVVIADATKINALRDLGIEKYDHVVVCVKDDIETSILIIMNLKELKVKKITLIAENAKYKQVFERIGADEIIIPDYDSAVGLANKLVNQSFLDYYEVADGYGIIKIKVNANYKQQTLAELDSRNRFDVNIVGIIRSEVFYIPKACDYIVSGDILVVIGLTNKLSKFEKYINS